MNDVLVYPSLNLFIPYIRFRDTRLAHHKNSRLTDPYDDPESNYLAPTGWAALCRFRQAVMQVNNTLAGRMVVGPLVGQIYFMLGDWRMIRAGQRDVAWVWVWHLCIAAVILAVVWATGFPIWAYVLAAYIGLSLLKIRTYAEHQAHEKIGPRSVVIEDRGPLALLFLNNNFHLVHHMHPKVAWYELPALYATRKDRFLRRNNGYAFASYRQVFSKYFLHRKDPVVHPLMSQDHSDK